MLQPCPFCGSYDIVSDAVCSYDGDMNDVPVCWVCCDNCGGGTSEHPSSAKAEDAWNTRVTMYQLEELRDECITCNIPHWVINFIDGILEYKP